MLHGGHLGLSSTTSNDELTIGGEGSTVAFSSDAHLSAQHARVFRAPNGTYMIEDAGSTNGTFVRVRGEAPLADGDLLFVGSTLLRVDFN
jgi:pSer/pThr/pTyr-binding forkhead associated (FHA) protein